MAESGCWGQSYQGPSLPQAFQELNSEVTVTVLVSEEDSTLTFLPGDRIGSGAQVHGAAKYIILHGSGGVSTVADWWGKLWLYEDEDLWRQATLA